VRYLYQSGYDSYLVKVGLGLGQDAKGSFALFNLECKVAKVFVGNSFLKTFIIVNLPV